MVAAKAVVHLLVRRHRKRAGLFIVERTEAEIVRSLFLQSHVRGDYVHNVASVNQLVQKPLGERHRACTSPIV